MCWAETSASVQWVATRTERDAEVAGARELVDGADAGQQQRGEPGMLEPSPAAASIHSQSVCAPGP